jgi:hypothetical protein
MINTKKKKSYFWCQLKLLTDIIKNLDVTINYFSTSDTPIKTISTNIIITIQAQHLYCSPTIMWFRLGVHRYIMSYDRVTRKPCSLDPVSSQRVTQLQPLDKLCSTVSGD